MEPEIKIEKGIPIPERAGRKGVGVVLKKLEVGESVFFPGRTSSGTSGSIGYLRPMRFTMRAVDGGLRIWRIE